MLPLDPRKQNILKAIIEHFVRTAEPVGSQTILVNYHLSVSPATIRSEMAKLEKDGFIVQPHTSAGRIPTDAGYRLYLQKMVNYENVKKEAREYLTKIKAAYFEHKLKEKIFDAVSLLAQACGNVSFATLPNNHRTFYLGVSNILKQPEYQHDPLEASQVIEILEESEHFITILKQLDLDDSVKIFIGQENILEQIESCGLIVTKYLLNDYEGFIGILGPKRMNYPFNAVILEEIRNLLKE